MTTPRACRFCGGTRSRSFADLGLTPLANSFVAASALDQGEAFLPLHAFVCDACRLVQLSEYRAPKEIFGEYAYFSSYSDSWLEHARRFAEMIASRLALGPSSRVVEIASNDGYLLKNFVAKGIPCFGVEPAANVARVAEERGVPTVNAFFGAGLARSLAAERGKADLIVGNNVLAHVPALNDFVDGLALLLAPGGTITMEFPHLQRLVEGRQFDTIYHEHFSYFSFLAAGRVFSRAGLEIYDVEELPTHGGSLRIYARHAGSGEAPSQACAALAERERSLGYEEPALYDAFAESVRAFKRDLLSLLGDLKCRGLRLAAYGAPAKGNTLLNYCGVGRDFIDFTVDRSPHKQGAFLPGTRIPVLAPEALRREKPDRLLILPWNLADEIMAQTSFIRDWGGRFIVPMPSPREL